ncbi:unnamed protein product [Arctogadus glacialis]
MAMDHLVSARLFPGGRRHASCGVNSIQALLLWRYSCHCLLHFTLLTSVGVLECWRRMVSTVTQQIQSQLQELLRPAGLGPGNRRTAGLAAPSLRPILETAERGEPERPSWKGGLGAYLHGKQEGKLWAKGRGLNTELSLPGAYTYLGPTPTWSLHLCGADTYLEPTPVWSLHLCGAYTYLEPTPTWSLHLCGAYTYLGPTPTWGLHLPGAYTCVDTELILLGVYTCVGPTPESIHDRIS